MPIAPPSGRRVPVALYICAAEDDAAALITEHLQQYAHARDWPVTEAVRDQDGSQPLEHRPGWTRVVSLVTEGTARGIVAFSPAALTTGQGAFAALCQRVAADGAFLVATHASGVIPHRTSQDAARRHNLADAAAGWLFEEGPAP
ncbi:hypothetical protein [Streptomyces sp. 891-h]|uniref:hypothetical protein n=1 Tax=Streptomyces sp. 891-h TaxID=2720714 RepID=UPI001FAA42E7|nr:hypothetical protein [Streptomyces sp. 891-h]UNZ21304.1 hypothetical protein HC362_33770 [Streptomyces sp. 891-h]